MSKRHELVNTKKAGGSDLDHPRAVDLNGKVILYVRVRLRAPACLSVTQEGGSLFLFINLSECPIPWG